MAAVRPIWACSNMLCAFRVQSESGINLRIFRHLKKKCKLQFFPLKGCGKRVAMGLAKFPQARGCKKF